MCVVLKNLNEILIFLSVAVMRRQGSLVCSVLCFLLVLPLPCLIVFLLASSLSFVVESARRLRGGKEQAEANNVLLSEMK